MGIAISHKLVNRKVDLKNTLDRTEKIAKEMMEAGKKIDLEVSVRRDSDFYLSINMSGCESLVFNFESAKVIRERDLGVDGNGFDYVRCSFRDLGLELNEGYNIEEYPQNELYYSADSCKTQFSKNGIVHKWACDLIRSVTSNSRIAVVMDEADYYHSGKFEDIDVAIKEVAEIMTATVGQLKDLGYKN